MSFHSINNTETGGVGVARKAEKQRYIKNFFNLMCRLAQIEECPVIIGGDFNLEIQKWKKDIERTFFGKVHVADVYQPAWDRDKIIDTFAVVYPGSIAATDRICELSTPIRYPKMKPFDHGPVIVSCTLKPGLHPLANELQLSLPNSKEVHSGIESIHEGFKHCQNDTELWLQANEAIKCVNRLPQYLDSKQQEHVQTINRLLQRIYRLFEERMRVIEHKFIDELSESEEVRSDMDFAHMMHMYCQKPQYGMCQMCYGSH